MDMVHNILYCVLRVWRGKNVFTIFMLIAGCLSAGGRLRDYW